MIALYLWQADDQILLITYLKFTKDNPKDAWKEKKMKLECDFTGCDFKNNKLNYKCKECGKRCLMSINGLIKKFPNMYRFCNGSMEALINLFCY